MGNKNGIQEHHQKRAVLLIIASSQGTHIDPYLKSNVFSVFGLPGERNIVILASFAVGHMFWDERISIDENVMYILRLVLKIAPLIGYLSVHKCFVH